MNYYRKGRDERTGSSATAMVIALVAALFLILLFSFGSWTTGPVENTAMNEPPGEPIQIIPQQGTGQPAQPSGQQAPPAESTTQP
jgi:hypothetical protein